MAPRVLRDVSAVDTATRLLGTEFATPLWRGADRLITAWRTPTASWPPRPGRPRAGALFVLSTRSTRRIEEVADVVAAEDGTWWFQVYLMRDRDLTAGLVRRAAAAGAAALVLTADTPVVGRKRRDSDDGVVSDRGLPGQPGAAGRPGRGVPGRRPDLRRHRLAAGGSAAALPVVVKGVLRGDDAAACRAHGAAAVIVSNHGGRQLDGALPLGCSRCPEVTAALGGTGTAQGCEVYADGGIRTGEDALAALALGARAVFLGRPALWALACGGADGVRSLLAGLTDDLTHAMALAGAASVAGGRQIARTGRPGGRRDGPRTGRARSGPRHTVER